MNWLFGWRSRRRDMKAIQGLGLGALRFKASIILDGEAVYKNRYGTQEDDPREVFNNIPLDDEHLIIVVKKEAINNP